MTAPRRVDVEPAPVSTERPAKYGARTRAIRRALVGHVPVESIHSNHTPTTGLVVTTLVPAARDAAALRHAAERAQAQVPWLDDAVVDGRMQVVRLLSSGGTQ